MEPITHFKGTNESERFSNDLLNETRRTNTLLEQLVQLLQPKIEKASIKKVVMTQKKSNQRGAKK